MNNLANLCTLRNFEHNTDVLDISDLIENRIDPVMFFETNFKTPGMTLLFKTAFERFKGKSECELIKLTQNLRGGKTYNISKPTKVKTITGLLIHKGLISNLLIK